MQIKWEHIYQRHEELMQMLTSPDLERTQRRSLQKELAHLAKLIAKHKEITVLERTIADAKTQAAQTDEAELAQLFRQEVVDLEAALLVKQQGLENLLIPPDEHDERSVFLEIRAGAGGQEAALFAADLVKMYTNYALRKNWQVSVVDESLTDLGGIRDVTLHIQGKNVYAHLKHEAGVHRVQRVPKTETQGRVHTSTATVAVLPEAKEVDVQVNPADIRIDVYRASGAGGQHVNTTDSAVRITHIPTGVVVTCQDERSQHKNKTKAMKMLQSRILASEKKRHEAEISKQRKEMVGRGMRSEKVRTYNFPQNRVTDHQVNLTLKKLDRVIEGDLDEIVAALQQKERQDRKKNVAVEKK
ncbi:MAG TPA: peptide chain release factor 1 [Candidatus Dependentiae bacterium]|nr:peptide chain release factor 1 [Candidatus Dependentiae bacterium]